MGELDTNRLWKALDTMALKLVAIEETLISIAKTQEKVKGIEDTLSRHQSEINELQTTLDHIETERSVEKGRKDIVKEVLKVAVGVLCAIVVYKFTEGG